MEVVLLHLLTTQLEIKAPIQFLVLSLLKVVVQEPINQVMVAMVALVEVLEHQQAHPHQLGELQHLVRETMAVLVQLLARLMLERVVVERAQLVKP